MNKLSDPRQIAMDGDLVMSGVMRKWLACRVALRSRIAQFRWMYIPLARLRHSRIGGGPLTVVSKETELVIEGFPRSANSFAATAFLSSQPYPVRLASHLHAPAHVMEAVRLGVPVMLIVRDPVDAILSLAIFRPHASIDQCIREYIRFYRPLIPFRNKVVAVKFNDVVSDFGACIDVLNNKLGLSFDVFIHSEENVKACFSLVDSDWRGKNASGELPVRRVGRPSKERRKIKGELMAVLNEGRYVKGLSEAVSVYNSILGGGA